MNIYIPFTYIIGWSKHKKFYYGAKYAQGCHPSDLWESYFTSSKYVKEFREQNGEPDIIKIHRTFSDKHSCVSFENKYLNRIDAKNSQLFLNKSNGSDKFVAQKTSKVKKWYNDGKKNYQINETEKLLIEKTLFPGMIQRGNKIKKWYWCNDGENNYRLTEEDYLQKIYILVRGKIGKKTENTENEKNYNFLTNKHKIPCYDKSGKYKRISKEEYYSQTGPMDKREWVFNTSKEGLKRSGKSTTKSTKNLIPCFNKQGESKRITKEQYNSQIGPMEEWEYVTIRSFEGKRRTSK